MKPSFLAFAFMIVPALAVMSSCDLTSQLRSKGHEEKPTVQTRVTDANALTEVSVETGELSGSAVSFPPGSLVLGTEIVLSSGEDLTSIDFNVDEGGDSAPQGESMAPAGGSLAIFTSNPVASGAVLPVRLSLGPASAALALAPNHIFFAEEKELVVLFRATGAAGEKKGMITSGLSVHDGRLDFSFSTALSYHRLVLQPAWRTSSPAVPTTATATTTTTTTTTSTAPTSTLVEPIEFSVTMLLPNGAKLWAEGAPIRVAVNGEVDISTLVVSGALYDSMDFSDPDSVTWQTIDAESEQRVLTLRPSEPSPEGKIWRDFGSGSDIEVTLSQPDGETKSTGLISFDLRHCYNNYTGFGIEGHCIFQSAVDENCLDHCTDKLLDTDIGTVNLLGSDGTSSKCELMSAPFGYTFGGEVTDVGLGCFADQTTNTIYRDTTPTSQTAQAPDMRRFCGCMF